MDVRGIRIWLASPRTKLALDITMAAAVTAYTISLGSSSPHGHKHFDTVAVLLTIASNGPMAFRRAAPVVSLVVCVASVTVYASLGYWAGLNGLGAAVALYTIATKRGLKTTATGTVVLYASTAYGLAFQDIGTVKDVVIQAAVLVAIPLGFGVNTRALADRNRRLAQLSEQLRRDQEALARHEVMAERVRIAQELHDIVGHHLSIIAVQSGLARHIHAAGSGTVDDSLQTIAATSREALSEVRRLLVVLRVTPDRDVRVPDFAVEAPGLDRLGDAVDRVRGLGIAVTVTVTGRQRRLPPGLDLCAYRVLQESLTNIVKHADATVVEISLDYAENQLTASVVDNGAAKQHPAIPMGPTPAAPGGHGLTGMRERAELYGGSVVAGPRPTGGFAVSLTLPIPSDEAASASEQQSVQSEA